MNDRRPASSSETVDGTAAPEPGTPALPHISGDAQDVSSLPTAPASRHGQFRILRPHARGGLGQVSLAMDETLGRTVAVKEIRADIAQNAHTRRRFVQEAEVTGQLEHPNIVPIYALGQDEHGRPYYAMRFVDGQTLEQLIAAYHAAPTPLAFQDLLRRFVAVCQAMAYAHSQEIIHRDLKPANIMTGRYGETLILDWGLAKRLNGIPTQKPQHESSAEQAVELPALSGGGETLAGQAVGTPAYMPPEQAGSSVDRPSASADIYALGAILYHILTNHPPHHGDSRTQVISRAARAEVARPSSLKAKLPKALEAVCVKAMARRPEDRYASATELAQEIERYLADEPVAAYRQPLLTTAARWARRHKPAVAAAAALLITAVVALAISNVLVARQRNATVRAERLAQSRLITEREAHREADAARRQAETERDRAMRSGGRRVTSPRPVQPLPIIWRK
jgi:eukaryotic-like serine/threonine-protein kinase